MNCVRRTPLDFDSCMRAVDLIGAIYFIKDRSTDTVKIGFSRSPLDRMAQLQVGNATRLELVGAVAAEWTVEAAVHDLCRAGHLRGEWFMDRGVLSEWLDEMTEGRPRYGWIWDLSVTNFLGAHRRDNLVRAAA